jgi:hypothetical protein
MQASADKVIATAQAADAAHEVAALSAQAIDNAASISRLQSIREKTHAAPVTTGCASSPAVSALLDGLRDSHSNHPGTTATGSR